MKYTDMQIKGTDLSEQYKIGIADIRAENKKLRRFEYSPCVGDTIRRRKNKAEVIRVCDDCIIANVDGEKQSYALIEWEYMVYLTIRNGASFAPGF